MEFEEKTMNDNSMNDSIVNSIKSPGAYKRYDGKAETECNDTERIKTTKSPIEVEKDD